MTQLLPHFRAIWASTKPGQVHLGLGRLYRRTGDAEQADAHLTTARTLCGEMGMTSWLEKEKG